MKNKVWRKVLKCIKMLTKIPYSNFGCDGIVMFIYCIFSPFVSETVSCTPSGSAFRLQPYTAPLPHRSLSGIRDDAQHYHRIRNKEGPFGVNRKD